MNVVFNRDFFRKLWEFIATSVETIKAGSPLAIGIAIILFVVIIIQQLILVFLSNSH